MDTELLITTIREPFDAKGERQPSMFELILVDQINDIIKPAIHHTLVTVADSIAGPLHPTSAILQERLGELCNFLILLAQWFCVRTHGGKYL